VTETPAIKRGRVTVVQHLDIDLNRDIRPASLAPEPIGHDHDLRGLTCELLGEVKLR